MNMTFGELLAGQTVTFTFTYWEACAIVMAVADKLEDCKKKKQHITGVANLYSNMRKFHHSYTAKTPDNDEYSLEEVYDKQLFETTKDIEMDGFSCLLLLRSLDMLILSLEDAGFETYRANRLIQQVLEAYQKLDLHDLLERSDYGTFKEEEQG